ncbi:hypothetical protein ACIGCZ_29250 [Streptomyces nigra]|uniref:hypothetical protein n=1 Tax=Streptomyces nigra TaxID=1827580 RepID=UPI0037D1C033
MSGPFLSPDTKAVLHAAEALTAQVRRVADALTTPVTTPQPGAPSLDTPELKHQLIHAMRARVAKPGQKLDDATAWQILDFVDAALEVVLPTTRLTAELARSADADVQRVIALYEQWVKAGPPPLGASMARWWDARLAELRAAILPPDEPAQDSS